jgi:hypothetical protein
LFGSNLLSLCMYKERMSCFKRVESEETLDISGPVHDGGDTAPKEGIQSKSNQTNEQSDKKTKNSVPKDFFFINSRV